jgi:hypothetical protein
LVPSSALATGEGGLIEGLTSLAGVLILLTALLTATGIGIFFYARWQRAIREETELRSAAERLSGVVGSFPLECIYWTVTDGEEFVSRRLSVLFEGGIKSFADLAGKFPDRGSKDKATLSAESRKAKQRPNMALRSASATANSFV